MDVLDYFLILICDNLEMVIYVIFNGDYICILILPANIGCQIQNMELIRWNHKIQNKNTNMKFKNINDNYYLCECLVVFGDIYLFFNGYYWIAANGGYGKFCFCVLWLFGCA